MIDWMRIFAQWVALLLVPACSLVGGCGSSSKYDVLGEDLLEVPASARKELSRAIWDASMELADSVSTQPGVRSFPSFGQSSTYWGKQSSPFVTRSTTTFRDKSGRTVRIEKISHRNADLLVFIQCEGSGDPLVVLNAITKSLDSALAVRPTFIVWKIMAALAAGLLVAAVAILVFRRQGRSVSSCCRDVEVGS